LKAVSFRLYGFDVFDITNACSVAWDYQVLDRFGIVRLVRLIDRIVEMDCGVVDLLLALAVESDRRGWCRCCRRSYGWCRCYRRGRLVLVAVESAGFWGVVAASGSHECESETGGGKRLPGSRSYRLCHVDPSASE